MYHRFDANILMVAMNDSMHPIKNNPYRLQQQHHSRINTLHTPLIVNQTTQASNYT